MADMIPALHPVSLPRMRARKRRDGSPEDDFHFGHWLADSDEANDTKRGGRVPYPVPLMSTEGILILAQAQAEEFAKGHEASELVSYEQGAEKFPAEGEQYVFDFMVAETHAGDVLDKKA